MVLGRWEAGVRYAMNVTKAFTVVNTEMLIEASLEQMQFI